MRNAVIRTVVEVEADPVKAPRVAQVADLPLALTMYSFESNKHLLTAAVERVADRDIARLQALLTHCCVSRRDGLRCAG